MKKKEKIFGKEILRLRGEHKIGVHVNTISNKTTYDEMDFYAIIPI